ncbi:hypothetical protein V6N13_065896 [Hibiscus sabdariffa]
MVDNHSTFKEEADNETYHDIVEDLCVANSKWNGQQVMEDKFDEVVPGTSGITKERLPMLMGLEGGKAKESTEEHSQSGAIQNVMAKLEKLEESVKGTKD